MPEQPRQATLPEAEGSCHCGKVRFRVRTSKRKLLRCNCSMCNKSGHLHLIVEADDHTLETGEEELTEYRFGTHVARHYFCRHCGITPFYVPRSHPQGFSVNFRCLNDYEVRLDEFQIEDFDGNKWEENIDQIR